MSGEGTGGPDDVLHVVLADDHAPTREAVRLSLEARSCEVLAEAADGPGAVAAAKAHHPDVCLLDIHMPGSGITAAWEITRALPGTAVVVLTASADDDDLFEALRAGASGYLLKDTSVDQIIFALRQAVGGGMYLPPSVAEEVLAFFRAVRPRRTYDLSPRETEVLQQMCRGYGRKEIADHLGISPHTVDKHVRSIYQKLHVNSGIQAVAKAFQEQIV